MESQPDTPVDPLDTSRARDAIFARIRNAQHRPANQSRQPLGEDFGDVAKSFEPWHVSSFLWPQF